MYALIIIIHIVVCSLLIAVILIQSGRGGGLLESFSGLDSFLGTKTNAFLVRVTSVLATIFLLTCLSLAFLSSQRSKSLMEKKSLLQQLQPSDKREENIPLERREVLPSKDASGMSGKIQEKPSQSAVGGQDSPKSDQVKKEASEPEK